MNNELLIKTAIESGATKAVVIPTSQLVVSAHFREICAQNTCGAYNRCWMCPPDIGPIDELMAKLMTYANGVWYQTIHEIEDSYDIEGMFAASAKHSGVSQNISKNVFPLLEDAGITHYLHLSCGGCHLCEKCAKATNEPCRKPDKALSSLEGYGINVYETTKNTPLKYINGQNTVTYFGMVLFGENE
ncbi:MAG: DUF2284 domain-containing protein [Eubacteriales bacterium]